jgi:hypothetical protein
MSCDSGRVLTFSINLLHYFFVVFDIVESYAPGFKDSVIGRDILTPPDLNNDNTDFFLQRLCNSDNMWLISLVQH